MEHIDIVDLCSSTFTNPITLTVYALTQRHLTMPLPPPRWREAFTAPLKRVFVTSFYSLF